MKWCNNVSCTVVNVETASFLACNLHSCSSEKVKEIVYVYLKNYVSCFMQNEALTLPTVGMNSKRNGKQKSPLELGSRGSDRLQESHMTSAHFSVGSCWKEDGITRKCCPVISVLKWLHLCHLLMT